MNRRQFLHWSWRSAAGAAAVVAGWQAASRIAHLRHVAGQAQVPGAQIAVEIDAAAPTGWQLLWQIAHNQHLHELPAAIVSQPHRGEGPNGAVTRVTCAVPYPYADLQPGRYDVSLVLRAADGALLATEAVGEFTLRRQRFSA